MRSDALEPADELMANQRATRPRWRNSALKQAPTWFHGGELDIISAEERRMLFDDADTAVPRVQWMQSILSVCWLPLLPGVYNRAGTHWLEAAGATLFAGVLVGAMYLRRRNVATQARRTLQERADWPQRLIGWRS